MSGLYLGRDASDLRDPETRIEKLDARHMWLMHGGTALARVTVGSLRHVDVPLFHGVCLVLLCKETVLNREFGTWPR
jgi:hypothetical protein